MSVRVNGKLQNRVKDYNPYTFTFAGTSSSSLEPSLAADSQLFI